MLLENLAGFLAELRVPIYLVMIGMKEALNSSSGDLWLQKNYLYNIMDKFVWAAPI